MIQVLRDPQWSLPEIRINQTGGNTSLEETRVHGIQAPLVSINGIAYSISDVDYIRLRFVNTWPQLDFSIQDKENVYGRLVDTPANYIQIQILPPWEGIYKKINLKFWITEFKIEEGYLVGKGTFYIKEIHDSRFEALGEMSTFDLCNRVSTMSRLGFASNVQASTDKRFIYCRNQSLMDILDQETDKSVADETQVYETWMDPWGYINFVNLIDRASRLDPPEDMKVWISNDELKPEEAVQTLSLFTNLPTTGSSQLFCTHYERVNNLSGAKNLQLTSIYNSNTGFYTDNLVGKQEDNDSLGFQSSYGGEVYGEYDYINSKVAREFYLNKLQEHQIKIYSPMIQLGIQRGDQLRLLWVDNNTNNRQLDEKLGVEISSPVDWIQSYIDELRIGHVQVNTNITGQYLVLGLSYIYDDGGWNQELTCCKL